jgi:hypothetical protein
MAPTEMAGPQMAQAGQSTPPSSPDQSSSEPKSSKGGDKPGEAQPETARNQLTDPSIAGLLKFTVNGSNELTDRSTDEFLRGAT